MKTEVKKKSDCERIIKVELPKEDVDPRLDKIYKNIQKAASLPGFRQGKVPQDLIRKKYMGNAHRELIDEVVPKACSEAIESTDLETIGYPRISDIEFKENAPLKFKIHVSIRPVVKIKKYKGIKIKKTTVSITDKEVDAEISVLQDRFAEYVDVADRPVKKADYVNCDLITRVGDNIIDDSKNIWLIADSKTFVPGLCEQFIGLSKGDEKDCQATLPKEYKHAEYAGKKANFSVKINEIKSKKLKAVDKEFTKLVTGEEKDIADFRASLQKDLTQKAEKEAIVDAENQILDAIIKESKFALPESLVHHQMEELFKRTKQDLMMKGLSEDDINNNRADLDKKLRPNAERQVRIYFILHEIANLESINIEDTDLEAAFSRVAKEVGAEAEKVKEHYRKEENYQSFVNHLKEEKVLKFLVESAIAK